MKKSAVVALVLVTALGVGGCSAGPADGGAAEGPSRSMIVGSFGGEYDNFLKSFVNPVFHEQLPDTEVLFSSGDAATLKTKLLAEVSADRGTYDVVELSDKDLPTMKKGNVLKKLDPSKISNWDNIKPELKDDYCVPHIVSAIVIMYNADKIKAPLKSWSDYFKPEILDQAGVWSRWSDYLIWAANAGLVGGDPGSAFEDGMDLAIEAGERGRHYTSASNIGQGLVSGEVNATIGVQARAALYSNDSSVKFTTVIPAEGTTQYISYSCIPENATNLDEAYEYLNAHLDPRAQLQFAENMFYAPTVTNVDLPAEVAAMVSNDAADLARIISPDMMAIMETMPALQRQWDEATTQ